MKTRTGLIIVFAVGFLAGLFGLTGPIHEFGHWMGSWVSGSPARIVGWNYCAIKTPTVLGALSGPFFEAIVLYLVTFWLLHRRKLAGALFVFANIHASFVLTVTSSDFMWVYDLVGAWAAILTIVFWVVTNGYLIVLLWLLSVHQFRETQPA